MSRGAAAAAADSRHIHAAAYDAVNSTNALCVIHASLTVVDSQIIGRGAKTPFFQVCHHLLVVEQASYHYM